jgi:hypothetical protein
VINKKTIYQKGIFRVKNVEKVKSMDGVAKKKRESMEALEYYYNM